MFNKDKESTNLFRYKEIAKNPKKSGEFFLNLLLQSLN